LPGTGDLKAALFIERQKGFMESLDIARKVGTNLHGVPAQLAAT